IEDVAGHVAAGQGDTAVDQHDVVPGEGAVAGGQLPAGVDRDLGVVVLVEVAVGAGEGGAGGGQGAVDHDALGHVGLEVLDGHRGGAHGERAAQVHGDRRRVPDQGDGPVPDA